SGRVHGRAVLVLRRRSPAASFPPSQQKHESRMTRQTRVGLLVLAGVLLFLLALFAIANRSFLFSDTFFVKARYGSVAGLLPGAEVHYQGVNVGRVESVRLPDQPGDKIVVTMAIR